MKSLKEMKIQLPTHLMRAPYDSFWRVDLETWEKLKGQCERVNALFDSAIKLESSSEIASCGVKSGFFIPMPEEPDSVEKFIRDMANEHLTDGEHNLIKIRERARALMAKGEK